MLETLTNLYTTVMTAAKDNPVLAGVFSLYGLGLVTYCCRTIPARILRFCKNQFTTNLCIDNMDSSAGGETADYYYAFMSWFMTSKWSKWSRNLAVASTYDESTESRKPKLITGFGSHFFFWKGRLFWFNKESLPSQGTYIEKERIYLSTFGRKHKPILDLINQFQKETKQNELRIYKYHASDWIRFGHILKRTLDSVILERKLKQNITTTIENFIKDKQWYVERGLPYKKTIILEGNPGTGKTSIIKALASHYNKNLCILDLSSQTNNTLENALSEIPDKSWVLIEDFDNCPAVLKSEFRPQVTDKDALNYGKVLNVFDGIVPLNDTIIFLTTNHINKIETSLLRKGRIDHIFTIPVLSNKEIKQYIELMFTNASKLLEDYIFAPIAGCDLQSIYLENRDDLMKFVDEIPKEKP